MTAPKPTIAGMLLIGHGNGLNTVDEAWLDYTRHTDIFFSLANYEEQKAALWEELRAKGILGMTIVAALNKLGLPVPADDVPPPAPGICKKRKI